MRDYGRQATPENWYIVIMSFPAGIAYLTLSQLTEQIEDVISESFHSTYWVVADVVDHSYYAKNGHHYFCLAEKDPRTTSIKAKISAAAWGSSGGKSIASFEAITSQRFTTGINVLVNVSVQFHPAYGLKLTLNEVDPAFTIGILEQERRNTLQRLTTDWAQHVNLIEGEYYTTNKGLTHASVIQRIASVTSANAAGYKDFRDTIEQNRFRYAITMDTWFTTVQGEANAAAICQRLTDIVDSNVRYDAVVIIRGGGSQLDLLIFDQYDLAKIIAAFPIPVITGIGHHINETIVDLMAHTAVKTPSIAAQSIISHNRRFEERILQLQQQIIIESQQRLAQQREALSATIHELNTQSRRTIASSRHNHYARLSGLSWQ